MTTNVQTKYFKKMSTRKVIELRKLRKQGWTYEDLAVHFDVSLATIRYWDLPDNEREDIKKYSLDYFNFNIRNDAEKYKRHIEAIRRKTLNGVRSVSASKSAKIVPAAAAREMLFNSLVDGWSELLVKNILNGKFKKVVSAALHDARDFGEKSQA